MSRASHHLVIALAAGLVAFSSAAFAQEAPPRPAVGDPPAFTLPETEHFALDNGLAVTLIPFGLAPKTTITVSVQVGNLNDGDQTWIADLTADLMQEGAAGRSPEDIARAAASMGGELSVGVGLHTTDFDLDVLSERGPDAIALIGDVVRSPDFPGEELDRLKANMTRNLSVARSQPQTIAEAAFVEALYGADHPYGRYMPSDEQVESYTPDDIAAFYEANYGAQRTHIYVAGQFDSAAMRTAIEDAFGDWDVGPAPLSAPTQAAYGPRVILIDRPGAPQSTIRLGLPAPTAGADNDIALRVANALLGGAFTSRITANIREDKGYTYSPDTSVSRRLGVAHWAFDGDVTRRYTGASLTEIFGEINRLANEVPEAEEAQGMRTWMSGIFILRNASTGGLINQISNRDLFGLPDDWLETFVPNVLSVSGEDMTAITAELLPIDQMILVVVGDLNADEDDPEESVEPQIRALPQLEGVEIEVRRGEDD